MRSSSDWVQAPNGGWDRSPVKKVRGLNRNFSRTAKNLMKGAATTVICQMHDNPLNADYRRLLEGGTKPNLAKLTIAHMDVRGGVVWLLSTADSSLRRKVVRVTRSGVVRVYSLADGPKKYVTDLDIGSDGRPRLLAHVRVTGMPNEERLTILDPTSGQESDAGLLTPAQPRPAQDDFLDLDCHDQPVTASIDGLSVYRAPGIAACAGAR